MCRPRGGSNYMLSIKRKTAPRTRLLSCCVGLMYCGTTMDYLLPILTSPRTGPVGVNVPPFWSIITSSVGSRVRKPLSVPLHPSLRIRPLAVSLTQGQPLVKVTLTHPPCFLQTHATLLMLSPSKNTQLQDWE